MPVSKDYLPIAGASGQTTGATVFSIGQSIRFDQDNAAHMQRTPSGASNRRTFTFSAWLKHTHKSTNGYHNIFCARADASNYFELAKEVALITRYPIGISQRNGSIARLDHIQWNGSLAQKL